MGILSAVKEVNSMSGELAFIAGRDKAEIDALLGRDVEIEEMAFVASRFEDCRENAIFTVKGDEKHFYRTGSSTAVAALKKLAEGLEEDRLGWDALILRFEQVRSKQGRRYYVVKAEIKPEVEAELALREEEAVPF